MFRFRLQNVLDLREQQERDLASQLVQALSQKRDAQDKLDELQATRAESLARVARDGAMHSVGELSNLAFILDQLDGHIASASSIVQEADVTVVQTKEALAAAFRDRHVLDRLRDRHQETHRSEAEQLDRRTMDDIALTRHTQHTTNTTANTPS